MVSISDYPCEFVFHFRNVINANILSFLLHIEHLISIQVMLVPIIVLFSWHVYAMNHLEGSHFFLSPHKALRYHKVAISLKETKPVESDFLDCNPVYESNQLIRK